MSGLNSTSWQHQRLRWQLTRTLHTRLLRRTRAVLKFDCGRSAVDLARMLGVSRQIVYHWVDAYMQDCDHTSLQDQLRRGRRPLFDEDEERPLEALLAQSPQDLGYPHISWTILLLQDLLDLITERRRAENTLRRALRRLEYGWKRPRNDLAPNPALERKTADSPANRGPTTAQCSAGSERNRPVALPAVARRVVQAWRSRAGLAERSKRPTSHLRGPDRADQNPSFVATPERPQR